MRHPILDRLDPAAAEILLEVASQPGGGLFAVSPRASIFEQTTSILTPQTTGLSKAERELVRVHRDEIGFLLHRLASSGVAQLFDLWEPSREIARVWNSAPLIQPERLARTLANCVGTWQDAVVADLGTVDSLATFSVSCPADVLRVACAAHRLLPSPATAINLAPMHIRTRAAMAVRQEMAAAIRASNKPAQMWVAYMADGLASLTLRDWAAASLAYLNAARIGPRTDAAPNLLISSILAGATQPIQEAIEIYEEAQSGVEPRVRSPWSMLVYLDRFLPHHDLTTEFRFSVQDLRGTPKDRVAALLSSEAEAL